MTGQSPDSPHSPRAPRRLKVLATDSGLGGLSVVAHLVCRLGHTPCRDSAEVVFFNARPNAGGFNSMTPQRQVRVFDRALRCMHERHHPEALLIACHTLSALYPRTSFAQQAPTAVHGIVEVASRLITERLLDAPEHRAILLATPITHEAGIYTQALTARGVPASRLLSIPARRLAGAIERGIETPDTQAIISDVAQRVRDQSDDPAQPHVLCLLCTHYPYASDAIRAAIERQGVNVAAVIDPNAQMAEAFLASLPNTATAPATVRVRVESQVAHDAATKAAIAPMLEQRCALTAAALRDDAHLPGLFALD